MNINGMNFTGKEITIYEDCINDLKQQLSKLGFTLTGNFDTPSRYFRSFFDINKTKAKYQFEVERTIGMNKILTGVEGFFKKEIKNKELLSLSVTVTGYYENDDFKLKFIPV